MIEASKISPLEAANKKKQQTSPTGTLPKRQLEDDDHEPEPKRTLTQAPQTSRDRSRPHRPLGLAFVKARNNGILESGFSKPPANLKDIRRRHARSRATASPPESVYNKYVNKVEGAGNEATLVVHTSALLKEYDDTGYSQAYKRAFSNLPGDVGFNHGLSAPRPDFVEGLEAEEYRPFAVDEHIAGAVLYRDDNRSITLPHIAGEWTGPSGDMRVARVQSAYAGAAMVYARNEALAYMGQADAAGHAHVTAFTTDGKMLHQYAHYATPSEDDGTTLAYHQYLVSSKLLTASFHDHKDARRGLRNAQDSAKAQSEELRDQLKDHWKQKHGHPPTSAAPLSLPDPDACDATARGDAFRDDDPGVVDPPCQPTPAASGPRSHSPAKPHAQASKQNYVRKLRRYWTKDSKSGRYYHQHLDGTVSWLDDDDGDDDGRGKVQSLG